MKNAQKNRLSLPLDILVALLLSALSALSLLIFHYMRSCEHAASYYSNPKKSLIRDALSVDYLWIYIVVAALLGAYYFLIRRNFRRGIRAGWLVSLPLAFNMILSLSVEHSDMKEIFLPGASVLNRILVNAVIFAGFAAVLSSVIAVLYCLLDFASRNRIDLHVNNDNQIRRFVLAYIVLFLCWIPSMVICYPGSLDMDALGQIKGFMGEIRIDAANPILSTLFYGIFFKQGRAYGSDTFTFFKIILIQNFFNAGFMALVSVRTGQYTKSRLAYFATILFFGLMPMWQRAAQHILKDVLHTGWYLAFYVSYLTCLEEERVSVLNAVLYCICIIFISFTRSAVFFIAVIATVILMVTKRRDDIFKFALCLAIVVTLYMGLQHIVYPALPEIIKPPRESENYSLQMQQVALYCTKYGDELSEDERRIINETLDYETIVKNYTPMIADPVKNTWHGSDENHAEFWGLYRKLILRHPLVFVQGLLMSSFEHFNPWYSGNRNGVSMSKDPSFHQVEYADPPRVWKLVDYWNSWLDHPVSRVFYGNGLYAWILIIMIGYAAKRRSLRAMLGLVPDIALMVGLFMSHVNGLLRYGYPLIAATPLICGYTIYAVSQTETAPSAEPDGAPLTMERQFSNDFILLIKGAFRKVKRMLKNMIRNICYAILRRLDEKE